MENSNNQQKIVTFLWTSQDSPWSSLFAGETHSSACHDRLLQRFGPGDWSCSDQQLQGLQVVLREWEMADRLPSIDQSFKSIHLDKIELLGDDNINDNCILKNTH